MVDTIESVTSRALTGQAAAPPRTLSQTGPGTTPVVIPAPQSRRPDHRPAPVGRTQAPADGTVVSCQGTHVRVHAHPGSHTAVFVRPMRPVDCAEAWSAFPLSGVRSDFELHRDVRQALSPANDRDCTGCWAVERCRRATLVHAAANEAGAVLSPCGWTLDRRTFGALILGTDPVHLDLDDLLRTDA